MKFNLQIITVIFVLIASLTNAQALTGDKIIGASGDYTSLSAAIDDINTKGVSGILRLLIDEDLTEIGAHEITTTTLDGNNSLVIKPNAGKTPTVTFTSVETSGTGGNAGIAVTGSIAVVGYITIDGSNTENGTTQDMTFALDDGTDGRYVFRLNGDTDHITIKNVVISAINIKPTSGSSSRTYGIYASSTSTAAADNLTVENCTIGSSDSPFYYAMYKPDGGTFPYGSTLMVSDNKFFAQHKGISIWGSDGESFIKNNEISVVGHPIGDYVQNSLNGIYCETWKGTMSIANNKIINLKANAITQSRTKPLYGIIVYNAGAPAGQTANITNNFISNFSYTSDGSTSGSEVTGIAVDAGDQTVNVYYNTIYMSNISTNPVYGIRVYDDAGQSANIKNNIIVNTVDQDNSYGIYADPITNNVLKSSDYNDIYVPGPTANTAYYNGVNYKTLADWKIISNMDANSISENPANPFGAAGQLTSLTDLHWVSAPSTSFAGAPITGFDTDIDGDTRSSSSPLMGADEVSGAVGVETISKTIPTNFVLNQNYPNPFNPTTTISFNLKVESLATLRIYDSIGREIATLVNEKLAAGSYNAKFSGLNLASGVYFYRLSAGSFTETKRMVLLK